MRLPNTFTGLLIVYSSSLVIDPNNGLHLLSNLATLPQLQLQSRPCQIPPPGQMLSANNPMSFTDLLNSGDDAFWFTPADQFGMNLSENNIFGEYSQRL